MLFHPKKMEFPFLIRVYTLQIWKQGIGYEEMNATSVHQHQHRTKHLKTYKHSKQTLSLLFVLANRFVFRKPWHRPTNSHYGPKPVSPGSICLASSKQSPKANSHPVFALQASHFPRDSRCPIPCYLFIKEGNVGKQSGRSESLPTITSFLFTVPAQHGSTLLILALLSTKVVVLPLTH
ncbi:hypothetical protein XENOCAPTIV_026055 [Xenoophorus captivus]|uniref:Uncharacterized protein n=1 Tax=Xenoophorus captivus TaxID=1517983 RepID=A0ABV0QWM4_9TELE